MIGARAKFLLPCARLKHDYMKNFLRLGVSVAIMAGAISVQAQERYLDEIFDDSEIVTQFNQTYGINVDYLKNPNLLDPQFLGTNAAQIQAEHNQIRDSILAGAAANIPISFFLPYDSDQSTIIKLTDPQTPFNMLKMDVYMPNPAVDAETARPVMVYIHTGNFLPKAINGGVTGAKDDSAAVELCRQWAKRGYVVIAPNYRLGWNPAQGTSQFTKTYTLLNAVYRAMLDVKQAVRVARSQAATLEIDPTKVAIYGQGSGGYVALAYNSLDSWEETDNIKFNQGQPINIIDTSVVGNLEGQGGLLNFYSYQGAGAPGDPGNSGIAACVNAGGALGDISWIDGNEAPFITIHAVRDQFAPFDTGTVIVPTTNELVVDVNGPNTFMPFANSFGVNDAWRNMPAQRQDGSFDEVTLRARSLYGRTFNNIPLININDPVTVSNDAEGLFALELPEGEGSPWEWWGVTDFENYYDALTGAGITISFPKANILAGAAQSNPNSKATSLLYIDSIQQYIHPRLMLSMQIGNWEVLSVDEVELLDQTTSVYPNPSNADVFMTSTEAPITSYQVVDLQGRVVMNQRTVNAFNTSFSVNHLPAGIYFVQLNMNNQQIVKKLIRE